jgi:hypothetical protein
MLPVILGIGSALAGVGGAVAASAGAFLGLSATTWGFISAGLTAASAFTSYQANNQQVDHTIRNLEQSRDIAREQFALRSQEEHSKAMDQLSDAARQARIQAARARVSSGEAGVAGVTVDRLMGEQVYEHGLAMAKIEKNSEMTQRQLDMELKGSEAEYQSKINQASNSRQSPLDAGLKIAGAFSNLKFGSTKSTPSGGSQGQVVRTINNGGLMVPIAA